MTTSKSIKTMVNNNRLRNAIVFFTFFFLTLVLLSNQSVIKYSLDNSIKICLSSIIPSIFPFMILSDFLIKNLTFESNSIITKAFAKTFSISEHAFFPFILGNICGFPLGAKTAIDLYKDGTLTKDECERLLGFANNPSIAFIISGIGAGMRKNISDGIVLFWITLVSACLVGIITRRKDRKKENIRKTSRQNFSLVNSIKDSAFTTITVCSYIVFFSIVAFIIIKSIKSKILSAILVSLLEIGTAASYISDVCSNEILALPLLSFSLAFSGFSVFMQTLSFLPGEINKAKYFVMKLLQGFLAFGIALIYNIIFK